MKTAKWIFLNNLTTSLPIPSTLHTHPPNPKTSHSLSSMTIQPCSLTPHHRPPPISKILTTHSPMTSTILHRLSTLLPSPIYPHLQRAPLRMPSQDLHSPPQHRRHPLSLAAPTEFAASPDTFKTSPPMSNLQTPHLKTRRNSPSSKLKLTRFGRQPCRRKWPPSIATKHGRWLISLHTSAPSPANGSSKSRQPVTALLPDTKPS